jgi:protocatechuate 3,4-dioxygenase beta subunit
MRDLSFFLLLIIILSNAFVNANPESPGQQNNEKKSGSISGRITILGKPAANFELTLQPIHDDIPDPIIAKFKTDKDGRYQIDNIKSSYYWLQVITEVHVNAKGIDADMEDERAGRRILVADGETVVNADLDLALGGMISGRIVDVDGKPVAHERVFINIPRAYGDLETSFLDDAKTDSNGLYKLIGIPPGRYAISIGMNIAEITGEVKDIFGGRPDGRVWSNRYFEETFYPGVTDRNKAVLLEIALGKELKNINFKSIGRAKTAYSVSGRVIDAKTGSPVRNCELWTGYYMQSGGYHSVGKMDEADENGYFKIDGLLPGKFYVSAYLVEEGDSYSEVVKYEIQDADVSGLEVHIYPGLTISGRVTLEGEPNPHAMAKLSQLKLSAMSAGKGVEQAASLKEVAVGRDGSFKIGGLVPDKLKISLGSPSDYLSFSIVRIENPNGQLAQKPRYGEIDSILNPYILPLDKHLTDLRVVLRYKNVATLRGHVNIIGGKLPANLRLMARITSTLENGGMGGWRHVDANGNFYMDDLEPGEYGVQLGDGMNLFAEAKTVKVMANSETAVSFDLDLRTIRKTN